MTTTRLQRTAAAAAALAFPASLAFFAPQAQAEAPADPYGPACASVPKEGAGSLEGMAKDPVATAASNNPELSTLVDAVKQADLVDTLNNAENITVFAPTNAAFEKIPQADLEALLNDKDQLTKVLTYHVVGEKVTTQQMEDGTFKTLEGSDLTTKGSGTEFTVNDSSKIVCGDVPTANATVNLVDTVLMPPS
ncbi:MULTISPECIES: fasciclin domain-containing protein [Streptomyces]|uniref:Fasciclin domain-containing protein n=2 Tax=Streptomyces TaxID=1883 RepID=A0A5D4IFC3_9ACTN|nr:MULTISPECIES: fasciclin domain-containing protein [Streptomyces]OSC75404.1 beta-Ig-H3/fasciclin [Streptomyces sp. BF-3]KAA6199561.1 fasciclin domain-containing protein [Streptomyces parvus]MCQ1575501.1 fasciclin domain-containing protein [Streptomyces parvus]NEC22659.1 fasciclin domain-containing protein [Streptomyces parvus]TYR50689.1 fasciclin domain-containing protein [Streptomyces parvus]